MHFSHISFHVPDGMRVSLCQGSALLGSLKEVLVLIWAIVVDCLTHAPRHDNHPREQLPGSTLTFYSPITLQKGLQLPRAIKFSLL